MRFISSSILAVLALSAGCSDDGDGGSGISGSTKLIDLDQTEATEFCHESAELWPERTITCSGQTITAGVDDADCASSEPATSDQTCTATVGDARNCFNALDDLDDSEFCMLTSFPSECAAIQACDDDDTRMTPREAMALSRAILFRSH